MTLTPEQMQLAVEQAPAYVHQSDACGMFAQALLQSRRELEGYRKALTEAVDALQYDWTLSTDLPKLAKIRERLSAMVKKEGA